MEAIQFWKRSNELFYKYSCTFQVSFFFIIQDIILRRSLRLSDARGQCYDGAASMSGKRKGAATVIKSKNPKCLYTHCYGHALNLAVGDSIKSVKLLSETFGTIKEVCKLVKKSPKRESHLKELRSLSENENRGVHAFCPTRWTIRGQSCQAMLENYDELMELWEWSLETVKETEMVARIRGVMVFMTKFKFLFGCLLGKNAPRTNG